MTIGKS
jgi:hypothetical protein